MTQSSSIDEYHSIEWRETPWDTTAFGFYTREILSINFKDSAKLNILIAQTLNSWKDEGVKFIYTRILSSNILLKNALQANSFYYAETSALVAKRNLQKEDFSKIYKSDYQLEIPNESDFQQIEAISERAFDYSRFHEDPNIDIQHARLRYRHWIKDLRKQNSSFKIYKTEGVVHSFLAYKKDGFKVTLQLGGSDLNKGYLSPYFWSTFLNDFKKEGSKRVSAVISVSNLSIFNLYIQLKFNIEKVELGFHRFL